MTKVGLYAIGTSTTLESNKSHTLNELAEQAGRDPKSIEILAFGFSGQFRSRTAIEELADAGANRVTIWLDQTAGDAALAEMDQIARQVLV